MRIHPPPPLPPSLAPTIPPSGLDYKSMEEFINEEACQGTMEGNRSCLRQYGPGRSDGQCGPPAFCQSGLCGQPQLLRGPISDFATEYDLNHQYLALVAAVENGIISQQERHRGFQTIRTTLGAPVKLTAHNIIHLIYFKCP